MAQSSGSRTSRKAPPRPDKPYHSFPLTPHTSGKWQKKIRGRIYYFGNWARRVEGKLVRVDGDGWEAALREYELQAADLHAGRTPSPHAAGDGLRLKDLCNDFLTAKLRKRQRGEIAERTFAEYKETTDLLVAQFGGECVVSNLTPRDFGALAATLGERWGPVRLANAITRVKSVFKFGTDNDHLDKTVKFGSEFKKPDQAVLRRHRAKGGEKMFEAEQLRTLIDAAGVPLRAMILLGVNAGFGNHDCAALPLSAIDLDRGWVTWTRPKTGIARRCPLWEETVAAVREAIAGRPKPVGFAECGLVFVTPEGLAWVRHQNTSNIDKVAVEFLKLTKRVKLHRAGRAFYSVRHTFRTVADAARDQPAADLIMGHTDPSMRARYVERIDDARLKAVTDHVREWLWPTAVAATRPNV
jgi:integrase